MKNSDDLLIILNILSSISCQWTWRLISAERDLNIAFEIFENMIFVNSDDRPDLPVLTKNTLFQKLQLQRALVFIPFGKIQESKNILESLIVSSFTPREWLISKTLGFENKHSTIIKS